MPEWFKGVDCKSIIRGFKSLSVLNKIVKSVGNQTWRDVSQGYTLRISINTRLSNGVLSQHDKIPDKDYYYFIFTSLV